MPKRDFARDPLRVEIQADGVTAKLLEPLHIWDLRHKHYVVPSGFVTDFASVPRAFWWLVSPWGAYSPAAVVHDFYYRCGIGTRKEADTAFLRLMEALKVPAWKRWIMFFAVRSFGWYAWRGE